MKGMAGKAFYEVLEEQIRADLRKEIEAEVRDEWARRNETSAPSEKTHEGAKAGFASGLLETWLLSNVGKTFFSPGQQARNSYRTAQGPAPQKQSGPAPDPSRAQDAFAQANKSSKQQSNETSSHTSAEFRSTPNRSSQALCYNATSIEDLCALELLRRYGAKIGDSFTENELKIAWRKAALATHPDRFTQADAITQARMGAIFRELADAYDKLQTSMSAAPTRHAA